LAPLIAVDQEALLRDLLKPDLSPPERILAQVEGWISGVPGFIRAGKERQLRHQRRRGMREGDARASRGGNFFALENCGAIATFVANFCRADFSGPRYGKP